MKTRYTVVVELPCPDTGKSLCLMVIAKSVRFAWWAAFLADLNIRLFDASKAIWGEDKDMQPVIDSYRNMDGRHVVF